MRALNRLTDRGSPGCFVAPTLGRLIGQNRKFPRVLATRYPSR